MFDPAVHKIRRARAAVTAPVSGADGTAASEAASAGVLLASEAARAVAGTVVDDGEADPEYESMLERAHHLMRSSNPAMVSRTKKRLKPPNVVRVGSTRSCWTNFAEITDSLGRERVMMKDYFLAELGTTGSLDDKAQLVLKGRHTSASVENLLRKYITAYVMCGNCKSLDTVLEKNTVTRLMSLRCLACASTRTVAAVRSGFKIVKRGQRRKERAAAMT